MSITRHNSAIFVLLGLVLTTVVGKSDTSLKTENDHLILTKAILIEPNYTGLDCYFNKNEECYWTWDSDNFTEVHESDHKPGQNGFIQADGEDIRRYAGKWEKKFFGPYWGPINRKYAGSFLYLLGQPRSDVANFTDKRLISELIRETGNNCTVSLTMNYDKIEGAIVEFGTQNLAKAYSAIKILSFAKDNSSSFQSWKTFDVKFGRYLDPFSISIDIRRSQRSRYGSYFAIDSVRLHNCEPGTYQEITMLIFPGMCPMSHDKAKLSNTYRQF